MARRPRVPAGALPHYVIWRGLVGLDVVTDAEDRATFVGALAEAARGTGVQLHGFALLPREVQLVVTPPAEGALARFMQALGRRYVSAYNRRHHRSGTLWDGRYRCAVVEPGAPLLAALLLVDGQPVGAESVSAGHRVGAERAPMLVDPPAYWALGNTPFEREAEYRRRLALGLPATEALALRQAALGGRAYGSAGFVAALAAQSGRALVARSPGRPRRT